MYKSYQPADLVDVFGSSDRVLEVVDGKRSIDRSISIRLRS
jgi:hypothetical protein